MPIKIVAKKKPKKDPFRADTTKSLNKDFSKRTAKANQEAMKSVKKKSAGGKADARKVKDPFDIGPLKDNRGKTRKDKYYMTAVGSPHKKKPTRKAEGGSLKPVPEGNKGKGLSKLPTEVRNKMGFMKKGGKVMKMRGGGMADRGISFRMR